MPMLTPRGARFCSLWTIRVSDESHQAARANETQRRLRGISPRRVERNV
jgi:hypothetical protein